jgi:hypothetical protein
MPINSPEMCKIFSVSTFEQNVLEQSKEEISHTGVIMFILFAVKALGF